MMGLNIVVNKDSDRNNNMYHIGTHGWYSICAYLIERSHWWVESSKEQKWPLPDSNVQHADAASGQVFLLLWVPHYKQMQKQF